MSEHDGDGLDLSTRARRRAPDRDVSRTSEAPAARSTVGKHTLTEGYSAGYTELDAIAFFERSLGEARAQLATLARVGSAGDRVAAVTAAFSLRRSLRTARAHLGGVPAPELAERHQRFAELEAQAGRALADAYGTGSVPPEAGAVSPAARESSGEPAPSQPALPSLDLAVLRHRREAAQQLAEHVASPLGNPPAPVRTDEHSREGTEAPGTGAVMSGGATLPHVPGATGLLTEPVPGASLPSALFVDDRPVAAGQMRKSSFLDELRAAVTAAADEELRPGGSAIGCPYIEQYFARYASRPARDTEAFLQRYAPGTRAARTAAEMIPIVVARVRAGVRHWRDTGQPPAELVEAEPAAVATAAAAGAAGLQAADGRETMASLEAELGPGRQLDGATASEMTDGLGADVSQAQIHTGPVAARKAADAGAVAFAIGRHVVMGAGAPAPGTLEGDALLAHELAHVGQQAHAAADPAARMMPIDPESASAEEDADRAAGSALARIWGGVKTAASRLVDSSRGFSLQRCSARAAQATEKQTAALRKDLGLSIVTTPEVGGAEDRIRRRSSAVQPRFRDPSQDAQGAGSLVEARAPRRRRLLAGPDRADHHAPNQPCR